MVSVIDKEELQAIHKGDDPQLAQFLESNGLTNFFHDPKQSTTSQDSTNSNHDISTIPLSSGYDYDFMQHLEASNDILVPKDIPELFVFISFIIFIL